MRSLHSLSVSTEQAAERLLAEAREIDRTAYMYRADDSEFGFWVICYYPPPAPAVPKMGPSLTEEIER